MADETPASLSDAEIERLLAVAEKYGMSHDQAVQMWHEAQLQASHSPHETPVAAFHKLFTQGAGGAYPPMPPAEWQRYEALLLSQRSADYDIRTLLATLAARDARLAALEREHAAMRAALADVARTRYDCRPQLLSIFAIPRHLLPARSPARDRLILLALTGTLDIRAYPRFGAFDLDAAEGWNLWLHDQRVTLADWLAHWGAIPVPAFPAGPPVLTAASRGGEGADTVEPTAPGVEIALGDYALDVPIARLADGPAHGRGGWS